MSGLYTPCQRQHLYEWSGAKVESLHETRGANTCLVVHNQHRSEHQLFKIPLAANSSGFTTYFLKVPDAEVGHIWQ